MKKKPLISIIITYYKKKNFLKKTLNSILNQTYKNYEIVFVYDDDDQKDIEYVKFYLSKFKKNKLIINKTNLGVAKSRNIAIKKSNGKYLAFIDSDDIWKKNKLSFQIDFMEKNNYHFSFTSYDVINENDMIIDKRKVSIDANYKNLYFSNFIGLSTVIIKKEINTKIYFPHLTTQEDFALWLKLAKKGLRLKHVKNSLVFWRKSRNSLSSNIFRKLKDAFNLYYIYEKKNLMFSLYSVVNLSYNKILKNIK